MPDPTWSIKLCIALIIALVFAATAVQATEHASFVGRAENVNKMMSRQ